MFSIMSVPRFISQSRFALSRGVATARATNYLPCMINTSNPQRQLSSITRFQQELVQTPVHKPEVSSTATRAAPSGMIARSIAITKLPKRAVKSEVQQLLHNAGFDVQRIQLRVNRFTFFSDSSCFIELSNEEQAQKAIKTLHGQQLHGRALVVRPIKEDFYWEQGFKKDQRFFFHDDQTPSQAIQPLLQGRRYVLQVENPGWTSQSDSDKSTTAVRREIVEKHFGPFGVEAIGSMNPAWRHRKKEQVVLAHIDFASKDGALQAIETFHGKEIEGRRVYLQLCQVDPTVVKQITKVDDGVLALLKESGLLN